MINVTHPKYPPQSIEEKWLEKYLANGWTVVQPEEGQDDQAEEPRKPGRPKKG